MGERQMTAAEAATAIAGVREYRQGLTGRAAGTVWIVWGLGLALLASIDLFIPGSQLAGEAGDHGLYDLYDLVLAMVLMAVAVLSATCVASYMVWKAHAIVADEADRGFKGWASAFGLAVAFMAVAVAVVYVVDDAWAAVTGKRLTGSNYAGFASPIWAAFVALTLAFRLRHRVPRAPGLFAAGALFVFQAAIGMLTYGFAAQQVAQTVGYQVFAVIAVFTTVGLIHFHRG